MKIYPTEQILKHWSENYYNNFDLFFVNDIPFEIEDIVITHKDAFKTTSSFNIDTNNLYEFWNLGVYNYVIKASKGWFENLNEDSKTYILQEQERVNNPLFIEGNLITSQKWSQLTTNKQRQFFKNRIDRYYDNHVKHLSTLQLPNHLSSIVSTFPKHQGSNCLSTVLYAITRDRNILQQWIKADAFLTNLKSLNYELFSEGNQNGDVIVYLKNNAVVHAAYQIDDGLFINKNGQTIFNPYKIATKSELDNEWGNYQEHYYRKNQSPL
ncbi:MULTISPECIES: hypothetical protein [Mammaliicoccus]|uniref:Uncharacterized protein n=2 Tax=Mammaliicoccus sciuri TaxID=1296 RepID=A0AAI8GUR8_MAMSC|nr:MULTISPECIES: hypothetical protein [Mammaliicoccus]PCQ19742.1 hypothetical protein CP995_12115 [Klebsiella pneumoniae]ASE35340.1 hypothetical protein CEP64_12315 [Mammaliicoccus sciuri]MCD8898106.1 hypothetical protein [Mammaliicoccus sciuri]MCY1025415.1 hypothetical protein [Mammaliicoccus sciuri]MEB7734147.1 hypothetical protein [Mammaliicoccus sciuri]